MESFLPFLSAAGLGGAVGAVVTTLLSSWLMRRNALDERRFREKKDAYVNLLKAINNSQIERISEAAELVGHWMNVCDLVASNSVRRWFDPFLDTNPPADGGYHPDRPRVFRELKAEMRHDLGIAVSERD
jgi:hypothetical protein